MSEMGNVRSFGRSELDLLVTKVEQWHRDRNLIAGSTDKDQFLKLVQEYGEFVTSVGKEGVCPKDDIGDMAVVLINMAVRNDVDIRKSLNTVFYYRFQGHLSGMVDGLVRFSEWLGLLSDSICKGDTEAVDLAIDAGAILIADLATQHDLTMEDCLSHAWMEIKDRKGVMRDGVFIKDAE